MMPESDCCNKDNSRCPNLVSCKFINTDILLSDPTKKNEFLQNYCNHSWNTCKRYITKRKFDFCPDFVSPDTSLTVDEIMDQFDNQD